ncbi:hypothetical protein YC2023_112864 [Brassica napus]
MAPLMCSSPPPRLRLPSFPPQLRPLVDPPPCTPLHLPLEAPSLLEPSDPPDSPFHLVLLMLFDTLTFSQKISKSPDLESLLLNMDFVISVGIVSLVSVGDTSLASKRLLPACLSQRFANLCFTDVLISLVWYLGFSHGSSMLEIRDTSNTEVLIKGGLAMLRIVNCALDVVSISGSLFVVVNSQGFVSIFSLMVVEFRGLLYVIGALAVRVMMGIYRILKEKLYT